MMIKNSAISPTVEEIKTKIRELSKEAPENWLEILSTKTGKTVSTVKSYIYNGRGKKKHLAPLLRAMNEIVDDFNTELNQQLYK
jgi:hypothetical protein